MCESKVMYVHSKCCNSHWLLTNEFGLICSECGKPGISLDVIIDDSSHVTKIDGGYTTACDGSFELMVDEGGILRLLCDECEVECVKVIHEPIDLTGVKCGCCGKEEEPS
jgi:hypothetical protein